MFGLENAIPKTGQPAKTIFVYVIE